MNRIDRLTTLMKHFPMVVRPAPLSSASLVVTAQDECSAKLRPQTIHFKPKDSGFSSIHGQTVFTAKVDWEGTQSPLFPTLPDKIQLDVSQDAEMQTLISLIRTELTEQRCGSDTVVNRLGEVLMVRLLRGQISQSQIGNENTQPGLLAGLADQRLSLAIIAMHDHPGRAWRNEDLAHQDLAKGERVERIAHRYGYGSPEGFARAFKKHFGAPPTSIKPNLLN